MKVIDDAELSRLKERVKGEYIALGEIFCPFFGETIKFTSEGFQHLLFKGVSKIKRRDKSTQYMRLKLFKLAAQLIRITKTVQEHHIEKQFIQVEHHNRRENILKDVEYWGFIAILDNRKIKVLVKQIGNGSKKFWSIIPNWSTRKKGEHIERITHTGDLEND